MGDNIEKTEIGRALNTYGWTGELHTGFWWGNLRERDHFGDPRIDGRIIIGWIFGKWDVGSCTGSSWLRKGTGGGHL